MSSRPSLGQLCRLLLKHAAFTVGGGSVTMVALERDLVDQHQWIDKPGFRTIYGLARLTPGTSILALVTGLGWRFYGTTGALLSLAISAIPGSVLAALLASAYQQLYENEIARRFLAGAAAAVCGLIGASVFKMVQPYLHGAARTGSLLVFMAALAAALFGISPFQAFIALGIAGYFLPEKQP